MSDDSMVNLNSTEFSDKLNQDKDAVLIDVRTDNEYRKGHIPNSVLINIYEPNFAEEINKLDRNKNYYLYCRSGNRSYHAGMYMKQLGFKNVYNLEYGIIEWNEPLEI
jgi:rhodanese-related sulfurtransferase